MNKFTLLLLYFQAAGLLDKTFLSKQKSTFRNTAKFVFIRNYYILIFLFIGTVQTLQAQYFTRDRAVPLISNFTAKNYSSHEQNFDILQAANGKIYVANFAGVLEFDGTNWNKIPMKSGMRVLTLQKDNNERIYAGGLSDFGYLQHDKFGKTSFKSLSDSLDTRTVGKITHIVCRNNVTYFLSQKRMFVYENEQLKTIDLNGKATAAFVVNKQLFVFFEKTENNELIAGLTTFEKSGFKKITQNFEENMLDIQEMVELPDKSVAVVTSKQGFYVLKDNTLNRMQIPLPFYIKTHGISDVAALTGNLFAMSTTSGGLVIIDSEGAIKQLITKNSGLNTESINALFVDKKQNIWLATNDGISLVAYDYPVSFLTDANSILEGKVLDILEFNNQIFIASSYGLFRFDNNNLIKYNQLNYACWDLLIMNNTLFVATSNGIYQIDENFRVTETAINDFSFSLCKSNTHNNTFFAGHSNSVSQIKQTENKLVVDKKIENLNGDINHLIQHRQKLYIESGLASVFVYDLQSELLQKVKIPFDIISGHLNQKADDIFLATEQGLFTIDLTNFQLKPYSLSSEKNTNAKWLHHFYRLSSGETLITDGEKKNVQLYCADSTQFENKKNNFYTVFLPIADFAVDAVFADPKTQKIWLGGKDGIVIIDNKKEYDFNAGYKTLITQIEILGKDTVLDLKDQNTELDFINNSLRFEFSYPGIPAKGQTYYRYFLAGFDKDTSDWTTLTTKDYTNLEDKNYHFYVEAKNDFNYPAEGANFSFRVLTPIYRRWWAILFYLALFFGSGRLILLWRIKQTQKEKEALEQIVRERTQEIYESKKKTEEQRDIAYKQKKHIMDSIAYAQKIQQAVLPSHEYVQSVLSDHFILFKPRDVVSGDFYWVKKVDNYAVAVAADCTGHGVPGAFMSMLGTSFLNEIAAKADVTNAGQVLNELRAKVKESLKQEGKEGEQKDGMDLALTVIDFDNLQLYYSGAYNPQYIIRKQDDDENPYELIQLKANRQPIGIYTREKNFETQQFQLQKGDTLYSFSDGFVDQFGGETGDKLKSKRFKELLLSVQDKNMPEQKELLDRAFIKWKRDLEQIDDVIVMGIRI